MVNASDNDRISQDGLDRHYRTFFAQQEQDFRAKNIASLVSKYVSGNGPILDMGCGSCSVTSRLLQEGFEVVSVDNSAEMISMSKEYLSKKGLSNANLEHLSIEDSAVKYQGHFHEVICLDVIEHIKDDRSALSGLYDLLEDGGSLILSVPALRYLYGPKDVRVGHYRRYDRQELIEKIRDAGFVVESVRWWNLVGAIATFIVCRLFGQSIDESFRETNNQKPHKIALNRALDTWFNFVENPFSFGIGLTLIVRAKKPTQSD